MEEYYEGLGDMAIKEAFLGLFGIVCEMMLLLQIIWKFLEVSFSGMELC
jgi:hypothetical protein